MKHPTVGEVYQWLDGIAPFDSAEAFDNSGLIIGDRNAVVSKVFFVLDMTEETVDAAVTAGAELIITHHPIIFSPIKRINYTSPFGRMLVKLTGAGISVIAAHTNWDKAPGGVGDTLAALLGLENVTALDDYVRLGTLPTPLTAGQFAQKIGQALGMAPRWFGDGNKLIRTAAVAGGSYGEGYEPSLDAGADAFLTGEIKHHEILDATAQGLIVFDGGHHATEHPAMPALLSRFEAACREHGWDVQTCLSIAPPFADATHM